MKKEIAIDWLQVERELKQAVNRILHTGLSVELIGNWLWLSGDTKTYAHDLREAGYQWSKAKSRWFYRPRVLPETKRCTETTSMAQIRDYYGSQSLQFDRQ